MATFDANFQAFFSGGSLEPALTGPNTVTITDNNGAGDTDFNFGENWETAGGGQIGAYQGFIDVGGETLYAFQLPSGDSFFYGNVSDPSALETAVEADPTLISGATFTSDDAPTCFAAGTLIATPAGEVAVDTLKAGDMVLTASGASIPVKWVGYQTVHKIFTPAERFAPVRIRAGALAEGVPHADLTVTADHGMLIDGLVVHAATLVNGTSILRVPAAELPERVTYYHIETEGHEVILANGAEAETFIDNATRRAFDNHAEFVALFGESVPEMEEMDIPRVTARRQLPVRVRQVLDARAMAVMADEKASA